MVDLKPTRRRLLVAAAAAGTLGLAGRWTWGERSRAAVDWRGSALGADARILLAGRPPSGADPERVVADCLAEIERLERIFSLYLATSEIVRLNADGRLRDATPELRSLIMLSRTINAATDGLFDPTIQPVWQAYALWHGRNGDSAPLPASSLAEARARVGLARLVVEGTSVRLPDGGALTFNGIAQGFITDRIAELLRRRGFDHVLLDVGEVRALGGHEDGRPFRIAIRNGGQLSIADAALATSSAPSLMLSPALGIGHILHPATGLTPGRWRSVTVRHASAAVADGLSTALAIATRGQAGRILGATSGAAAWFEAQHAASET